MNRSNFLCIPLVTTLLSSWLWMGCPETETTPTSDHPTDVWPDIEREVRRDTIPEPVEEPDMTSDVEPDQPVDPSTDPARDPSRDILEDPSPDSTIDAQPDQPADSTPDSPSDLTTDVADAVGEDVPTDAQPTCLDQELGSALGTSVASGTTVGQGDDFTSAICVLSGEGAEDVTLLWTAPTDGNFQFDTQGSDFDTVLYLLDGDCEGAELHCNDDESSGSSLQSSLTMPMSSGQSVVIVIDGYDGSSGSYVLNINERVGCASDVDLGSAYGSPLAAGYLSGSGDDTVGSCGMDYGGEDISFTWTAPANATFRFSTEDSDFDTVLYLYGDDCVTELACNDDDYAILGGLQSLVELELLTGDQVVVVIDGYTATSTGIYYLNIYNVSAPEEMCVDWADDDADGLIDCADPTNCQGTAECTPGTVPSGGACDAHNDCSAVGSDPSCFIEDMGWPAGYCGEYCDPDDPDCPEGAICVSFVGGVGHCMDRCDGSCRADTMPDYWSPGDTISYLCDSFGIWDDGTMICGPSWWLE